MKKKFPIDQVWAGAIVGLLGTALGGILFGLWWAWMNDTSLGYYFDDIAFKSQLYRDSILTASALLNVFLFWIALRLGWEQHAKGILMILLLTVPFIVYFQATSGTW